MPRPVATRTTRREKGEGASRGVSYKFLLRWQVILLGFSWCLGTSPTLASAETKKVTGTHGSAVLVARSEIFLASTLLSAQLESRSRSLISQDPDWSRATLFSTTFFDPAMQLERKGYGHMVITHHGGDQTFLQYEVTWKNIGSIEFEWEIRGLFARGTGKFRGISGTWHERGKRTSTGDFGDWEVEYTLP